MRMLSVFMDFSGCSERSYGFFVSSVWPLGRTPAHVDSTKLAPVMGSLRKGRREERAESDPKLMLLIL